MTNHSKWKTIKHESELPRVVLPKLPLHQELWAMTAGEKAFQIRVPIYNNPYKLTTLKNAWMRGFKRAERAFGEALRRSKKIQESLPIEEVEA
jgi:hypothetical protein